MKKMITIVLFVLGLMCSGASAQILSNSAVAIPVDPVNYVCYPASGAVAPSVLPSTAGCSSLARNGSAATVATSYTNFTVVLSTAVPVGQSVRVDLGDFSSGVNSSFFCTIPAGEVSCSAIVPSTASAFTVAVGDLLAVNFNNSTGSQSFIIESARWTLQ